MSWIASIKSTSDTPQGVEFTVEYTDGTKFIDSLVIPQDEDGLIYWVKSRLNTLNSAEELPLKYPIGTAVGAIPLEEVPTTEVAERDAWLNDYLRYQRIKTGLIDTGLMSGDDKTLSDLRSDLQVGFKPEYLNFI